MTARSHDADLSPYKGLEVLGEGGTGRVYLAKGPGPQKTVALKVFHRAFVKAPERATLVVEHAKVLQQLGHSQIVPVYDAGTLEDGNVYVAMERLKGRDMGEALAREEALDYAHVVHIVEQACQGLQAAHEAGLVHQDLKPNNIFLVPDEQNGGERAVLLDFAPQQAASTASRDETRLGTPEYWSPEQACGRPLDARSDVYSLGVVMYEALTGILPFRSHSYSDIIAQHVHAKPSLLTAPASRRPIPAALQDLVLRCLAKEPSERFQSAAMLREAIADVRESLADMEPWRSSKAATVLMSENDVTARRNTTRIRPLFRWSVAIAAAALALATGAAIMWTSEPDAPSAQALAEASEPNPSPIDSAPDTLAAAHSRIGSPRSIPIEISSDPRGAYIFFASGGRLLGITPTRIVLPYGEKPISLVLRFPAGERAGLRVMPDRPGHAHVQLPSTSLADERGTK